MSKITCALSASQIKDLFKYTYKTMQNALEAGETFNANLFMENLFEKIAKTKDVETAAKFLQQVPRLIYTAAGTDDLVVLNFDVNTVRSLISKFKNPDIGFDFVMNTFRPELTSDQLKSQMASVIKSENELKETNAPKSGPEEVAEMRPYTPFTSTFIEFVKVNPETKKGILSKEVVDPERITIYNTLRAIKNKMVDLNTPFNEIVYQGKKLSLKAVKLTSVKQSMLDKTTKDEVVRSASINKVSGPTEFKGEIVVQAKDRVALIIVDENGQEIFFDENGNITTEAAGGKIVYQFTRNVRASQHKHSSKLRVTDIYGVNDLVMSPTDLLNLEIKQSGLTREEYIEVLSDNGKTLDDKLKEIDKQQQNEFKKLKAFNEKVTQDNKPIIIPFNGVSSGIPPNISMVNPTFGQIQTLPFVNKSTFQEIRNIKESIEGFASGASVITINGTRLQIDKIDMSEDIANKIAHVLTNPKLTDKEKYDYASLFMSNSISDEMKRYNIYLNEATNKLEFSLRPHTAYVARTNRLENNYKPIALIPENINKIFQGLKNGYFYQKNRGSKMTYNEVAIANDEYFDYNIETGKFNKESSSYIDLIMSFGETEVYVSEDKNPNFFNSYMHFDIDEAFDSEVKEVIKETKKQLSIAEKKAAVVSALQNGAKLTGKVNKDQNTAGYKTETQWTFTDTKGSKVAFYSHSNNITQTDLTKDARLVLEEPFTGTNGVYYATPVAVYIENKRVGWVQEKAYSAGDRLADAIAKETTENMEDAINSPTVSRLDFATTTAVEDIVQKSDEEILSPAGVNTPEEDDEIPDFIFNRSAELPNNVTQEQIDAAKKWWYASPLSKFIDIEHMTNIVNSNVFARFIASGKTLSQPGEPLGKIQVNAATKGNYVDVYHEAWHVFSQLFLTKNEKIALYNEIRNSNKKWANLNFLDIEELIAEDFRSYALDSKVKKNMPKRNTIFRKILNFLKKLFGKKQNINNTSELRSVKDLFEKLYFADKNQNILNDYTPLVKNVMWNVLNRGPETINNKNEEALNSQDGKQIVNSIDSIFSEVIDKQASKGVSKAGSIAVLSDDYKNADGISNKELAYGYAKKRFISQLNNYNKEVEAIGTPKTIEEANRLEILNDNIRIVTSALDNWGDKNSGIIKYHIEKSTFDIVRQKALTYEIDSEEDPNNEDKSAPEDADKTERASFEKKVGETSLEQMASAETLYILKSLFKVKKDGSREKNRLGFDQLADFPTVWNNVTRAIGGIKDPAVMYAKLLEASLTFPELKQLVESKLPDPSKMKNTEEMAITTGFWQSFRKSRVTYIQLTMFQQTDGSYMAEVTEASNDVTSTIYKFKNKFKAAPASRYIDKTAKNNSVLNLENIVADFGPKGLFDRTKSFEFVRSIGVMLDDLSIIKETLDAKAHVYGLEYIFKIVKRFNELDKDVTASAEAKKYVKEFKEDPIKVLSNPIPAGIISEKEYKEKNLLEELAQLQSRYGMDGSNFSVLNAERNLVFEHIEDFSASLQVDAINDVTNMKELWTNSKYQFMSYLNPNINTFTMRSKVLNSIFNVRNKDDQYNRRRDRKLVLNAVSGTQLDDKKTGANTTSLDKYGKFIQEMHTMLKDGLQEFMRHASKSASFGARVSGGIVTGRGKGDDKHLYIDIDQFAVPGKAEEFAVENIFIDYIASELERIIKFKANIKEYKNYSGYNRVIKNKEGKKIGLAGEFFTAFDDVLSSKTKNLLLDNTNEMDTRSIDFLSEYLEKNPEVRNMIMDDITSYFSNQTDKNLDFFSKNEYVDPNLAKRLSVFNMTKEDTTETLVKAYTYNSWIHNFEMANIFYGDLTQHNHSKDEGHKRIPGATSGGNGFRTDVGAQDFVNNILNANVIDPNTGAVLEAKTYAGVLNKQRNVLRYDNFKYKGTFNTAILQDVVRSTVYLSQIEKGLKEDYNQRLANVSKEALLEQFNKEERKTLANATVSQLKTKIIEKRLEIELKPYKEMTEGDGQGYITIDAYRTLKTLEGKWGREEEMLYQKVIQGKEITAEEVTKLFPVYKVQNFGHLANVGIPVNAMHKFALAPLIPSVIKGSDLESLHEQMLASNIQYATFASGSKVGNVFSETDEDGNSVADKIYSDKNQTQFIKPDANGKNGIQFTKNTIYLEYLKNVTNVPNKFKKKTIFSTQLRKLILEGMYKNGTVASDNFNSYINEYENAVDEYSKVLRLEILNEIGYEFKNGKYEGKLDKFLDIVIKELDRRELPQHLIEYIGVTPNGTVINDLSYHLEADEIEKILVSLIQKRLIKQKVKGEALVQVASSMTKGMWGAGPQFTKATEEEIRKYLGSNTLPFYNSDSKIDLDLLYKNNDIASLKDILVAKEKIRDNNSAYWTPTYKNRLNIEIDYLKSKIAGKKPKVTTIDTGTSAMKVAVAMQGDFNNLFKAKHLDGSTIGIYDTEVVKGKDGKEKTIQKLRFQESLDRLNELIKNDEWLDKDNNRKLITMTAVRIPVQGLNSMEFMEVHHFLLPEASNIIIPPTEIVAKSGADYDVDKLTTFMPNIDTEGRYVESLMSVEDLERIIKSPQVKDAAQAERIIKTHKAALENKLIESTRNILALPENYANLIRPNDTYLLKDIADELEPLVVDYDKYETSNGEGVRYDGVKDGKPKKVISPTRMLEIGFNIHKQEVNMGGKEGLSLVALKNALHPMFSSIGAKMPRTYKASIWNDTLKKYEEGDVDYNMTLRLKHNSDNGFISLSGIYDVDGIDRISDIFNHKMNGLVDVEKDSWIFNIQGNVEVLPVLSYLIMVGVPRQTAVYFVSQPLIRQYVERQRIMKGPYAKITGNTPSNNRSVEGQAALDVLENKIPLDVIQTANRLKLIDDVSINKANEFTVAFKADSKGVIKQTTVYSKDQLIKILKNPESNIDNLASVIPAKSKVNIIKKVDANPTSTQNYYYTATAAAEDISGNFDLNSLTDLVDNNDSTSRNAIAAFTHFLEIEKQIEGLSALENVIKVDTKIDKTIEEIIQREYDLEMVAKSSKLDRNMVNKLRKESILSEFFDSQLVKDLLEPLFILRNGSKVSEYITKVLNERKSDIGSKFGFGTDNTRMFINQFKNAIVNYAYQNYMTNSMDSKGNIVDIPEMYNDLEVVAGTAPNGARVEGDKMIVDLKVLESDYTNGKYEVTNLDKDNYTSRGLRPFAPADDLFQSKSSFFKYVMEREYLRSTNSIKSLELNKDYTDFLLILKKNITDDTLAAKKAYEVYLNQKALFNTFNRRALMVVEDYSFTNYFFNVINEFPVLKEKYPVLTQFTEPKIFSGEKVITLNNKGIVKGEIAENYYQNILDLANPQIAKVKSLNKEQDVVDNKRISDLFQMLPLVSLYTNGIGYSKYGINKVLPYDSFMDKIFEASKTFTANKLNENTFDDIFYKLIKTNRSIFVDYVSPLTAKTEAPVVPLVSVTQTESGGLQFGQPPVMPGEIVEERITTQPTSVTNNASQYTNHSGGAKGYDAEWDLIGREYGMTNNKHYLLPVDGGVSDPRLRAAGVKPVDATNDIGEVAIQGRATGEAQIAVTNAERAMGRIESNHTTRNTKKIRNYAQVKNADGIFAIGSLIPKGAEITLARGQASKEALVPQVNGGTSVAVQLGIMMGKPTYVFNQVANKTYSQGWYKWDNSKNDFVSINTPVLTKNFAGIGTSSNTTEQGKQAIRDVYENTFKATTQPTQTFTSVTNMTLKEYADKTSVKFVDVKQVLRKDDIEYYNDRVNDLIADRLKYAIFAEEDLNNRQYLPFINKLKENGFIQVKDMPWVFSKNGVNPKEEYAKLTTQPATSVKGINISTKSTDKLGRELTNPNWGAKNIMDIEAEYKANASKIKAPELTMDKALKYDMNLMYKLQMKKFKAHPELIQKITDRGGVKFLEASEHTVGVKGSRWEGKGTNSNFIKVLIKSYEDSLGDAQPTQPTVSTPVANIPQNKVSGVDSFGSTVTANAETIKALGANPHSIDMIEAGFRTRTTRSESEMAKYAVKVGDIIKHFGESADGTTKNILAKVTAIHPKGTTGFKGTWAKEGWRAEDVNVIDRFKDGAAAIEFEIIKPNQSTQPSTSVENKSSIVKNKWTKDSPKENPDTAYIFTENINSIGSSRVGGGSAVIRNNPNAIGIVTKKYYVYQEDRATSKVTGGWNQDFQDTEADFELFKKVNLEQFAKIDKYETKIFPQGFASDLAKIPTRFAKWLQSELLNRYGLVTELNANKTGLVSKSITQSSTNLPGPATSAKEGQLNLFDITPEEAIANFYSTLTDAQKQKLGTLEDLYEEYNQIPYEQSVEDFIDEIKTCKL